MTSKSVYLGVFFFLTLHLQGQVYPHTPLPEAKNDQFFRDLITFPQDELDRIVDSLYTHKSDLIKRIKDPSSRQQMQMMAMSLNIAGSSKGMKYYYLLNLLEPVNRSHFVDGEFERATRNQLIQKDILINAYRTKLFDKTSVNPFSREQTIRTIVWDNFELMALVKILEQLGTTLTQVGLTTEALSFQLKGVELAEKMLELLGKPSEQEEFLTYTFTPQQRDSLKASLGFPSAYLPFTFLQGDILNRKTPGQVVRFIEGKEYGKALSFLLLFKDQVLENMKTPGNNSIPVAATLGQSAMHLKVIKGTYYLLSDLAPKIANGDAAMINHFNMGYSELEAMEYRQFLNTIYNQLGVTYSLLNNSDLALKYSLLSWNLLKTNRNFDFMGFLRFGTEEYFKDYSNKSLIFVTAILNTTNIYMLRGKEEYKEAERFVKEGIDTLKSVKNTTDELDRDFFELYGVLGEIIFQDENRAKEALGYFHKCYEIAEKANSDVRKVFSYVYYSNYYLSINEPDSARNFVKQGIDLAEKINDQRALGNLLAKMGVSYQLEDKDEEALDWYARSEEVAQRNRHYGILNEIYVQRGIIYGEKGDKKAALHSFEKGIAILENRIINDNLGINSKRRVLDKRYITYVGAIEHAIALKDHQKAFQYVQQSKSRTFDELLETGSLVNDSIPVALRSTKVKLLTALNELTDKKWDPSIQEKSQINMLIDSVRRELDIVDTEIRVLLTQNNDAKTTPISIEEIQHKLDPNEVFLEYFFANSLYVFLISKQEFRVFALGDKKVITEKLIRFRSSFIDQMDLAIKREGGDLVRQKEAQAIFPVISNELYQLLIEVAAAENFLTGKSLVIGLDGELYNLPFELLVSSPQQKKWSEYDYLVRNHDIRYYPSISAYVNHQSQMSDTFKEALVVGKTSFKELESVYNFPSFDLSSIMSETEGIRQGFAQTTYLIDSLATTGNLAELNLKKFQLVHFSTHGFFDSESPDLSFLVLDKGKLYARQVFNLEFENTLIVLSSCNSGRGQIYRGGGIIGFTQSFMTQGASGVTMGLWNIEVNSGNKLFSTFYKNLLKMGAPAKALREAQLEAINSDEDRSNPFFWAPYVYFGA